MFANQLSGNNLSLVGSLLGLLTSCHWDNLAFKNLAAIQWGRSINAWEYAVLETSAGVPRYGFDEFSISRHECGER